MAERQSPYEVPSRYIEAGFSSLSFVDLHVANNFRVMKSGEEQTAVFKKYGLPPFMDFGLPEEIRDELYRDCTAGENGEFTFEPGVLTLGQTEELVSVPKDEHWVMMDYLWNEKTGKKLSIRSQFASGLKPGSYGYQAFEFYNESRSSVTVKVGDIFCPTLILPMSRPVESSGGQFAEQNSRRIRLGRDREVEAIWRFRQSNNLNS